MHGVLDKVAGVETGYVPKEVTNHVPRLWVRWDETAFNFSREDCFRALQERDPSIVPFRTPMGVTIVPWMLARGQEKIVAQRFGKCLSRRGSRRLRGPQRTAAELAREFTMDSPIDEWYPVSDGLSRVG
jgi:hypothetical protein